jgi:hypothetical protein
MEWLKDTWVTIVGYVVISIVFIITMRGDNKILGVKLAELTMRTSKLEEALQRITEVMVIQARQEQSGLETNRRLAWVEQQIKEVWAEIIEMRKKG